MLTTSGRDEGIVPAMAAGATGCLLKDAPREERFRAGRAASRGEPALTPSVAARLMGRVRTPQQALSTREVEVLGHAARGRTNLQIGRLLHVSEATVKTHISRILSKLALRDRVQLVVYAFEHRLVD